MCRSELHSPAPVVLKLGGAAGVDHASSLDDVAERVTRGDRIVVVHGGSDEANRLGDAVGHPARTLRSPSGHESRHTDPRTLELFVMATALVNRRIVGALQARGVDAVGLSGLDGGTLVGARKEAIRAIENGRVRVVRDDWSGRIREVHADLMRDLLDEGRVPVLAPVAMTERGEPLNVDGDRAAAAVAGAL
ncbi:MAG: [LysW]-aminoadipate kinase, partial [Planctomycetota bacterium]